MKTLILYIAFCLATHICIAQMKKEIFEFKFESFKLNGVLNMPESTSKGIAIIVHGSGRTNAVKQELHHDIRKRFVQSGYGVYMWDKMGCGKSEGTFDYNQSVQNSADEVIAAIEALKESHIPGSDTIGLWGISRAGWINPLVIDQYKHAIAFWISVSGVDEKENFKYLLKENLRIEGHPRDSIKLLVDEWQKGIELTHSGKNYDNYKLATPNLHQNKFWLRITDGGIKKENYVTFQEALKKQRLDKVTGLPVYVENFDLILTKIDCPVLALFGEKDKNVDWTKTKQLYERTLGLNSNLSIKTFSSGNHNLFKCNTGGFFEFQDHKLPWVRSDGFLDTMTEWLLDRK